MNAVYPSICVSAYLKKNSAGPATNSLGYSPDPANFTDKGQISGIQRSLDYMGLQPNQKMDEECPKFNMNHTIRPTKNGAIPAVKTAMHHDP